MAQRSPKSLAVAAVLGALGNVLAIFSMVLGNIHPQVAVDLSHVATISAAYILDPIWAMLVGALISIVPFVRFGLLGSLGPIAGSLIFPGKALTGLFSGLLAGKVKHPFIALTIGYVPESIFTWASFKLWIPFIAPEVSSWLTDAIIFSILIKAWIEILFIGVISEVAIPRISSMIPNSLIDKPSNRV